MLSGSPGALESPWAVIASVRQWNELQLLLTRGDNKKIAKIVPGLSLFDDNNPHTLHHTHTLTHTHTYSTHFAHIPPSPWLFRQRGSGSRILLPKSRA